MDTLGEMIATPGHPEPPRRRAALAVIEIPAPARPAAVVQRRMRAQAPRSSIAEFEGVI